MPKNARDYQVRRADQAMNDLERALGKLAEIRDNYGDTHPDYAQTVEQIGIMVTQAYTLLEVFRKEIM